MPAAGPERDVPGWARATLAEPRAGRRDCRAISRAPPLMSHVGGHTVGGRRCGGTVGLVRPCAAESRLQQSSSTGWFSKMRAGGWGARRAFTARSPQ